MLTDLKRQSKEIFTALQRHNTESSKQIFPVKELRGLSPNFHIHVSVSYRREGVGEDGTRVSFETSFDSKQIFPEKESLGLSPNFHIHVSVSDLYIPTPTIGLPILLQENMWTDPGYI